LLHLAGLLERRIKRNWLERVKLENGEGRRANVDQFCEEERRQKKRMKRGWR